MDQAGIAPFSYRWSASHWLELLLAVFGSPLAMLSLDQCLDDTNIAGATEKGWI